MCDLGLHHLPQPRSVGESRTELGVRACQFRALQKNKIHLDGGVSRRHRTEKEKLSMKNEGIGADGNRNLALDIAKGPRNLSVKITTKLQ